MKIRGAWLLLSCLWLITGCSMYREPLQVYRFNPVRIDRYEQGAAIHISQTKELTAISSFVTYLNDMVVLNLLVENNSSDTLLFTPELCYYQVIDDTLQQSLSKQKIYALDPEKQIVLAQVKLNQEKSSYRSEQANDAILGVISATADVLDHSVKPPEERAAEAQEEANNQAYHEQRRHSHEKQVQLYEENLNRWEVSLRKTTMEPGKRIVGKIFFPLTINKDQVLRFSFPMQNRVITVDYKQYSELIPR